MKNFLPDWLHTRVETGVSLALFADPQIWFTAWKQVDVGTRINLFYHVLFETAAVQAYLTVGVRQQF